MKKKLLAILTGAAITATCFSALAACGDGKSGEQIVDPPKTTVDNFEEWWQAVTDSLSSENFVSVSEYSYNQQNIVEGETSTNQQNYSTFCERQGDVIHISEENAPVGAMYGETNVKENYFEYSLDEFGVTIERYELWSLFEYYEDMEDFPVCWTKEIESYETPVAYGELDDIQLLTRIGYTLQEMSYWNDSYYWLLWEVLGVTRYGDNIDEGTTAESIVETMKQNAEEFYRNKVTYSAQDGFYCIHTDTDNDMGNGSEDLVFNFLNGKISKLTYVDSFSGLYRFDRSTVTVNFSYGNANVTIPEEVKLAAEKTEENNLFAKSLEGNYKLDSAEEDGTYLRLTPGLGNCNTSVFGNGVFSWQVISRESVVLGGLFENVYKTFMLSIEQGALVYTADDGTEYRFIKEEQTA